MKYQEFKPAELLAEYIAAYWTIRTNGDELPVTQEILPDTCTDIIVNLGSAFYDLADQSKRMEGGKAYLVGTMTTFSTVALLPGANLFGIRFKPFGMNALLGLTLNGTSNQTFELDSSGTVFLNAFSDRQQVPAKLFFDSYFGQKINRENDRFFRILENIKSTKGSILVSELARNHHITERQLERNFKEKTGVTAKEFIKQNRLFTAVDLLKQRSVSKSCISEIAFQTGFYDHAHLAKDIKKYTGKTASDFV